MTAANTAPSHTEKWDFGGYPYALMPLVLPEPATRLDSGDMSDVETQLQLLATEDFADRAVAPESTDRHVWFRWIIGNQACSALWQALDDELELVLHTESAAATRNAEALLDGYSVLLIYSSTPTQEIYHGLIRPAMRRQHRSFSGRWAKDYVPVMTKLQSIRAAYRGRSRPDFIHSLIEASKRNHRTHVAVAAKLVPGEESLLRANDGGALAWSTEETCQLYDAFYSTHRALISRERIVAQLIIRLRAAMWDLETNGLYPEAWPSQHECPTALWTEELMMLERNIANKLRRTAEAAVAALRPVTTG